MIEPRVVDVDRVGQVFSPLVSTAGLGCQVRDDLMLYRPGPVQPRIAQALAALQRTRAGVSYRTASR